MKENKLTLKSFNKTIKTVGYLLEKSRAKYFLCFGSLLGIIRDDGVVEGDTDIDIGVMYEDHENNRKLANVFNRYNYKLTKKIIHDVDKKPLYMCFEHVTMPCIDIFFFIEHQGVRWHTYDTMAERKEIPSKYIFKGLPAKCLKKVKKKRFGTRGKPLLDRPVGVPAAYGGCLDSWYPDYKTPRKGCSEAQYMIKSNSCKVFNNKKLVLSEMAKSNNIYESEKDRLR